ncbi:MAG: PrpF family protein [Alphaproteobacteria bacterium]|nr:PrpF family protein [Alphaproteobacteria bacterium]
MKQVRIPAAFIRGGTSNAIVFHQKDLPEDRAQWDAVFLAAIGSPDPNGRQLNGMGGGISSLSKVCVVGPSSHPDADIDYTFAQVAVRDAMVDYAGNCGNMSSAMGPFAVDEGLVSVEGDEALIRIHNTNTKKIIHARFSVDEGFAAVDGILELPGVSGTGSPVSMEFVAPGGAGTGTLLPTGNVTDTLDIEGHGSIEASLVDAANPGMFVAASDLGLIGNEMPADLDAREDLMALLQAIRKAGAAAMGFPFSPALPMIGFVAPPRDAAFLSGETVTADDGDLLGRMVSMGNIHRALPLTGSLCMTVAARIEGTVVHRAARHTVDPKSELRIVQPSGVIVCTADVGQVEGAWHAEKAAVMRTQRRLFDGYVYIPASALAA